LVVCAPGAAAENWIETTCEAWQTAGVKEITVQQLHEETERWVRAAAHDDGIAITEHNRPLATLTAAPVIRRGEWLRQRLADLQALPVLSADSGAVVAALRKERA
jgi:antitoxin (DNA-binding transcriptional repressor) of toxin-antitoxin stability system